jgi:hypothetical protein
MVTADIFLPFSGRIDVGRIPFYRKDDGHLVENGYL